MRKHAIVIAALALCAGLPSLNAAEKKIEGGPKGGRILEKTSPKAEFFVEKDYTVTIAFYDEKLKPVPVADQQVTVNAGKQKLEFEKKGDVLASKGKLPEGDGYQVAVQYREKADAKPQNHRFKMDTHTCGTCKRAEYACTCDE